MIQPSILIFTDLDDTLLDHTSYRWDKAEPALNLCLRSHIPVIMVSSKTCAEIVILLQEMKLSYPFISENGGGIFFPKGSFNKAPPGTVLAEKTPNLWRWSMGTPYESLVRGLQEIREELGWPIRGFSEMTTEEISHLTGLDLEGSRRAAKREYDEPFILLEQENRDLGLLHEAAEKKELKITAGGRFYHLHGKNDKGKAVKKIISWYKESYPRIFSIALGDSPIDFSMFKCVDQPVLIRSSRQFTGLDKKIPGLKITREKGPEGWNSAVLEIVGNKIDGGGMS